MLLSICIPTITIRKMMFDALIQDLKNQIGKNDIEIVVDSDDYKCIGEKRNELLMKATGEYVCFFDDDDRPSNTYIDDIIKSLTYKPDCCSLKGIFTINGRNPELFIHSIKYKSYFKENGIYYRPPNHLNVIKTEIAKQFKFPHKNFGEDTDWAMMLCKSNLLKNEVEIPNILYYYNYIRNK